MLGAYRAITQPSPVGMLLSPLLPQPSHGMSVMQIVAGIERFILLHWEDRHCKI